VNAPSVSTEEYTRLEPFLVLGERLGAFLAQMTDARIQAIGVRYYGVLAEGRNDLLTSAVLVGLFKPILSSGVSAVNVRAIATDRGMDVIESRSSRPRNFTRLMSVKLHTNEGERWAEGAVFDGTAPRLVLVDGIAVEAPLEGTMLILRNADQPGVIGDVGTILGRQGVNIAMFALGRVADRAIGVVNIDDTVALPEAALAEIRAVQAVVEARVVRV
jgi:D-3-phosphoglycerate dehydrogenase